MENSVVASRNSHRDVSNINCTGTSPNSHSLFVGWRLQEGLSEACMSAPQIRVDFDLNHSRCR